MHSVSASFRAVAQTKFGPDSSRRTASRKTTMTGMDKQLALVNQDWAKTEPRLGQDRTKTGPRLGRDRTKSGPSPNQEWAVTGPKPNWAAHSANTELKPGDLLMLNPANPPGRQTRKARAFEADIRQLRAQGYTFQAIKETLARSGVLVSKSTVQREAGRLVPSASALQPQTQRQPLALALVSATPIAPAPAPAPAPGVAVDNTARSALTLEASQAQPLDRATASPDHAPRVRSEDIAAAFVAGHFTHPLIRERRTP
jgi:hypothetical protein